MSLKSIFISIGLLVISFVAHAEEESFEMDQTIMKLEEVEPVKPERSWKLLLASGYFGEYQKSVNADSYETNNLFLFSYGLQYEKLQYLLSQTRSEQITSTGNLSVRSNRRSWLLDTQYLARNDSFWTPMVGVSLGAFRDTVTTRFGSLQAVSQSETLLFAGVSGGVQFRFLRAMYSDLVLKVIKRESAKDIEWASQATLGLRL